MAELKKKQVISATDVKMKEPIQNDEELKTSKSSPLYDKESKSILYEIFQFLDRYADCTGENGLLDRNALPFSFLHILGPDSLDVNAQKTDGLYENYFEKNVVEEQLDFDSFLKHFRNFMELSFQKNSSSSKKNQTIDSYIADHLKLWKNRHKKSLMPFMSKKFEERYSCVFHNIFKILGFIIFICVFSLMFWVIMLAIGKVKDDEIVIFEAVTPLCMALLLVALILRLRNYENDYLKLKDLRTCREKLLTFDVTFIASIDDLLKEKPPLPVEQKVMRIFELRKLMTAKHWKCNAVINSIIVKQILPISFSIFMGIVPGIFRKKSFFGAPPVELIISLVWFVVVPIGIYSLLKMYILFVRRVNKRRIDLRKLVTFLKKDRYHFFVNLYHSKSNLHHWMLMREESLQFLDRLPVSTYLASPILIILFYCVSVSWRIFLPQTFPFQYWLRNVTGEKYIPLIDDIISISLLVPCILLLGFLFYQVVSINETIRSTSELMKYGRYDFVCALDEIEFEDVGIFDAAIQEAKESVVPRSLKVFGIVVTQTIVLTIASAAAASALPTILGFLKCRFSGKLGDCEV